MHPFLGMSLAVLVLDAAAHFDGARGDRDEPPLGRSAGIDLDLADGALDLADGLGALAEVEANLDFSSPLDTQNTGAIREHPFRLVSVAREPDVLHRPEEGP